MHSPRLQIARRPDHAQEGVNLGPGDGLREASARGAIIAQVRTRI
jgi:hypothetical protein